MAILGFQLEEVGDVGVIPRIIKINTNDTIATVTTTGYLNKFVQQGNTVSENDVALVLTKTSPSATTASADFYNVTKSGTDWSLTSASGTLTLASGDIFIGNASNVATAQSVTGDIGITTGGVTSITAGAIVNADVNASAAIDFSKLAALTDGNILVGSGANVPTSVSMSGDVAIANTGATTIQANAVESSMLAEGLVQHAQVSVDLATFIGSYTASVVLVAAPGAGKKLILHRATLWIDYGGTVLADGGAVHIQYDSTANGGGTKASGTIAAATLIAATADTTFGFSPVDTTLVDSTTLDTGLYFATATADFTGGTNSVYRFDIWYSVADFN